MIPVHPPCHPDYVNTYYYCTTNVCTAGKNNYRRKKVVDISGEVCSDNYYYKCDCPPIA